MRNLGNLKKKAGTRIWIDPENWFDRDQLEMNIIRTCTRSDWYLKIEEITSGEKRDDGNANGVIWCVRWKIRMRWSGMLIGKHKSEEGRWV